jgi:hypothetical protein
MAPVKSIAIASPLFPRRRDTLGQELLPRPLIHRLIGSKGAARPRRNLTSDR